MLSPLYVCGSTASGKSAFAIALANKLNGEIINADAYQVYRGIETIVASPSQCELKAAPHHLFSKLETSEEMDAQRFRDLALKEMAKVQSKNKTPIFVGGSGMYLKFLTHGPSPVPAGDEELRSKLELLSDEELIAKLEALDPEGATQTNLKNRRYVIRAVEICLLSGKKMSAIKTDWKKQSDRIEKQLKGFVIQWQPEILRQRIHQRTTMMLKSGAIEEIQKVKNFSHTCVKAIGIPQIQQYLAGEISLEKCHELIYFATCQYAKRQRTWFKKESWLTTLDMDETKEMDALVETALTYL